MVWIVLSTILVVAVLAIAAWVFLLAPILVPQLHLDELHEPPPSP